MTTAAKKKPTRERLTPEEIADLNAAYKEVAVGDDEDTVARRKNILRELRRVKHEDLHPNEPTVTMEVPRPRSCGSGRPENWVYKINEVPYVGRVTVPLCVAQQLASMIYENQRVDENRMKDNGNAGGRPFDLGVLSGLAAQYARQIQEA
jgi:hypothetical protein